MSTAKKQHRSNWDEAFYMARTDPEREKPPRLESTDFELPECAEFDMQRCLKAWRAIGLINNPQWILKSMALIEKWSKDTPSGKVQSCHGRKIWEA